MHTNTRDEQQQQQQQWHLHPSISIMNVTVCGGREVGRDSLFYVITRLHDEHIQIVLWLWMGWHYMWPHSCRHGGDREGLADTVGTNTATFNFFFFFLLLLLLLLLLFIFIIHSDRQWGVALLSVRPLSSSLSISLSLSLSTTAAAAATTTTTDRNQ